MDVIRINAGRDHFFPRLIDDIGLDRGAELGVAKGSFSASLLQRSGLKVLFSIDRWNDHHDLSEYVGALEKLNKFASRSVVIRSTFEEALPHFREQPPLDFIYVDGYAHTGQEAGKTLEDWWPLLRPGGVFAGHDYHERWQPTVDAVNAFAEAHGVERITLTGEERFPSWHFMKA